MHTKHKRVRLERQQAHLRIQKERKEEAIRIATNVAYNLTKDGKPLKRPRSGKEADKVMRDQMEQQGYVPDGKGGWRRIRSSNLSQRQQREFSSISKSAHR